MIFSWIVIGLAVGLLLGLTGAGGAIVAIPLFVQLTGASLREATVLSLASVASGALVNWYIQRQLTHYWISISLLAFSIFGSIAFRPLKAVMPDWAIVFLFASVGGMSLLSVWRKSTHAGSGQLGSGRFSFWLKSAAGGFGLGGLVTLTGLGGGVILVPLLRSVFGLSLAQAAATSLLTIFLTSMVSLTLQWGIPNLDLINFALLSGGSIASALVVRALLRSVSPTRLDGARRLVLTMVILASIGSLLMSLFTS